MTTYWASGTYRQSTAIALSAIDNGHSWQPEAGASPVVSGAQQVTGFTLYSGSIYVANVTPGSYSQDVFTQASGSFVWQRRVRAQALASSLGTWTSNSTGFAGTNTLAFTAGMQARGQGSLPWMDQRCPITAITSSQITIDPQCLGASVNRGGLSSLLRIENSLPLLTQAGQWYLDESAWKLYYWFPPSESSATTDVELGTLPQLVAGSNVNGFTVSGLTFSGTTWNPQAHDGTIPLQSGFVYQTVPSTSGYLFTYTGSGASMAATLTPSAVTFTGSRNISISNNSFMSLGNNGLAFLSGTNSSSADENQFVDIGGIGVEIGNSMLATDALSIDPSFVHDNSVTRNFFANNGQIYWSSPDIQVGFTTNTVVTQNEIMYSPYDGIQVGGFACPSGCGSLTGPPSSYATNTISNNQFHGAMRRQNIVDGGSIYLSGALASGLSHTVNGNITDNQANVYGNLYFDTSTSFVSAVGNVLDENSLGTSCTLFIQVAAGQRGLSNSITGGYSTTTSNCQSLGFTFDPSNTFPNPTVISSWYSPTVSSIVTASATPLRDPIISHGVTTTQSSTASGYGNASLLVDGDWSNYFTADLWQPASAPGYAQIDLGSAKAITAIEVAYPWGGAAASAGYSVLLSNDSTFSAGVTTAIAYDSAGTFESYFGASVEEIRVNPAVSARYVRVSAASAVPTLAEVFVHGH